MKHTPRKRWGQHFLTDKNLLKKIVRIIQPDPEDVILEIGPGQGSLTELIAPRVKQLIGIEIDSDLFKLLREKFAASNCQFINTDFLKVDMEQLPFESNAIRVVGNIPYNITSPVIFKLLESLKLWKDIHLMVQKEVADRLTAKPGSKTYGRLTVMVQALMNVKQELVIPPDVFSPKPVVYSSFLSIQTHEKFDFDDKSWELFSLIVQKGFGQRRKMLKNSLKEFEFDDTLNIDFELRPEMLAIEDFVHLSKMIKEVNSKEK